MFSMEIGRFRQIIVFIIVLIAGLAVATAGLLGGVQWGEILAGVAGGLSVWVCTYVVVSWIDPSFKAHHETTTKIWNVVTGEYLSLEDDRRIAKGSEYYSQFYDSANKIKISGFAQTKFITYLTNDKERRSDQHLLSLMKKQRINVEILLVDPNSEIIKNQDKMDEHTQGKCFHSGNIVNMISKLNGLYREAKEGNIFLHKKSTLSVRLSMLPLNTTLFYAGYGASKTPDDSDIILMGMLYNHKEGNDSQLFRLPKGGNKETTQFRQDLITHFDKTFDVSVNNQLLLLHGNGTRDFNDLEKHRVRPYI